MLYYQHLCEDGLYEGTSKFAEGYGTSLVFGRAKEKGMNVTIHWMDKNSSSAKAIGQHYQDKKLMLCSGHAARAHQKALKNCKQRKLLLMMKRIPFRGSTPMWTLLNGTVHIATRVDVAAYRASL